MLKEEVKEMIYTDVFVNQDGVYQVKNKKDGSVQQFRVGNYLKIISQEMNIDTKLHTVQLEFKPINSSKLSQVRIKASDISSLNMIASLAEFGVDVCDLNKKMIMKALRNQREEAPYSYTHSSLGVKQDGDITRFHHHHLIMSDLDQMSDAIHSAYIGPLAIQPKGDRDAYYQMIEEEVLGVTGMELALVLGASSAVLGLLATRYPLESLFFHLPGESSTGKSTAAMLAASVWGSPVLNGNGLVTSWNTTLNSLQKKLIGNHGIVFCLDEVSQYIGKNITQVIYSLAEGVIRSRLTKDSQQSEPGCWNTVILSTGEKSLMDEAHQNSGLRIRLFELELNQWTQDARNSSIIKETIITNYGYLGIDLASELMNLNFNLLDTYYRQWMGKLSQRLPDNPFKERIVSKLAVLLVTGQLLHKIGVKVDIDSICDILVRQIRTTVFQDDISSRAYQKLKSYYFGNKRRFTVVSDIPAMFYEASESKGLVYLDHKNNILKIAISVDAFKMIMNEMGFESPSLILKIWKGKGILDCEKGKLMKRINIDGVRNSYYVLKFNEAEKIYEELSV